jgi:GST-like protein
MVELVYVPSPLALAVLILLEWCQGLKIFPYDVALPQTVAPTTNRRSLLLLDDPPTGGGQVEIGHAGAAMVYLADKARALNPQAAEQFYPADAWQNYNAVQWVMWQTEKQRFRTAEELQKPVHDSNRLFAMLEQRLQSQDFIAGAHYSIADMMCYPWVMDWLRPQEPAPEFPKLHEWLRRTHHEPVESAMTKPRPSRIHPLVRAVQIMADVIGDDTTRYP